MRTFSIWSEEWLQSLHDCAHHIRLPLLLLLRLHIIQSFQLLDLKMTTNSGQMRGGKNLIREIQLIALQLAELLLADDPIVEHNVGHELLISLILASHLSVRLVAVEDGREEHQVSIGAEKGLQYSLGDHLDLMIAPVLIVELQIALHSLRAMDN